MGFFKGAFWGAKREFGDLKPGLFFFHADFGVQRRIWGFKGGFCGFFQADFGFFQADFGLFLGGFWGSKAHFRFFSSRV